MTDPLDVAARGIRTYQSTGAGGAPQPAEFFRRVDDTTALPAHSVAIDFLVKAHARRSANFGVFSYDEPGRAAGYMRLEQFSAHDLRRIDDWLRVDEIGREIGYAKPPRQWMDRNGRQYFHSPIPYLLLGSGLSFAALVVLALSLSGLLPDHGGIWIACLVMLPLFLVIVVQHAMRLRWWVRARAHVMARGERLPYGLGAID